MARSQPPLPILYFHLLPGKREGRGVRNEGVKSSLRQREGGKAVFQFVFLTILVYFNWQVKKKIPQIQSVLPVTVIGKWLPCLYLDP